jgi:hypothetical protein
MQIDVGRFHDLADAFASSAGVTVDEACAAVQIAYLAAELGGALDPAGRDELRGLCRDVCYVTGSPPVADVSDLELDPREQLAAIRMLARELGSAASRGLAYAMAYLSIDDIDSPILAEVRAVLELDDAHTAEVVAVARGVLSAEAHRPAHSA